MNKNKILSSLIVLGFIMISFSVMINPSSAIFGTVSTNANGNVNLVISKAYNDYYTGYTYSSFTQTNQNINWLNNITADGQTSIPSTTNYNVNYNTTNIYNELNSSYTDNATLYGNYFNYFTQNTYNYSTTIRNTNINSINISINFMSLYNKMNFTVTNELEGQITYSNVLQGIYFPQYNLLYYYTPTGWSSYSTSNYLINNKTIYSLSGSTGSGLFTGDVTNSLGKSNIYLVANNVNININNQTISNIGSIPLTSTILQYDLISTTMYQININTLSAIAGSSSYNVENNLTSSIPNIVEFTQFPLGWSQQPEFAPFSTSYTYISGNGLYWNNTSSSAILSAISFIGSFGNSNINYIYNNYTTNNQIYFDINIEITRGFFDLDLINNIGSTYITGSSNGVFSANITYNSFNNVNAVISGTATFSGYPYTGKFQGEVLRYGYNGYIEWKKSLPFYNIVYYNLSFTEANLPSGTTWSVTINGVEKAGIAGGYINFTISTGSFNIEPSSAGYSIFNTNLTMDITGVTETYSRLLNFTNARFINVWINTTGLGSSIANLYIGGSIFYITGDTKILITNGTNSISVKNPFGYTNNLTIRTIDYQLNNSKLLIGFNYIAKSLIVNEIGLRTSLVWSVSFNNTLKSINTNSVSFVEIPATYTLAVSPINNYSIASYSSSISLTSNLSITIQFEYLIHTLTINTYGLKNSNTLYNFTIAGKQYTFNNNIQHIKIANGTYTYSVLNMANYTVPTSQSITISSANSITLQFEYLIHTLTLKINGLNNNILYDFTINGKTYNFNQNTENLQLANGTYNWTLSTPAGYQLNQSSGQVIIGPSNTITVSASSTHFYKVTFISNINSGELYLFLNGNEYKTNLASSNIINASLVNGTYSVSYSLSNYSIINNPTVTVIVNGNNETVYLTFSKNPSNSNFIIDNLPYISVFMIISTLLLIAIGIRYSRRE